MIAMKTDDFARRGTDLENESEWRAFRYVLGEMSPAEADAFEEILATDQEMRELVARSTGLVANLLHADSLSNAVIAGRNESLVLEPAGTPMGDARPARAAMPARRRQKISGWAVTGLAAAVCCCVAAGLTLFSLRVSTDLANLPLGDASDGSAGNLVAIWSERLADLAPEQAATESAAAERTESSPSGDSDDNRVATATENAPASSAAASDQMADDDADVPPWMIAAVELGQVRKADGSSSEIREN
jgi:anti-sigma-K factor RskA